jgi:hypothetical protein
MKKGMKSRVVMPQLRPDTMWNVEIQLHDWDKQCLKDEDMSTERNLEKMSKAQRKRENSYSPILSITM